MRRLHHNGNQTVNRKFSITIGVITALSLLSGCSYVRSKFGRQDDAYKNTSQGRPLEVPPDLDSPNRSGTLVIPEPGTPSSSLANSDTGVPAVAYQPPQAPPSGATASIGGDGLVVADTLANTWRRVGLALERSGVAVIQSRNEGTRSYEIQTTGKATRSPGWFKRAITLGMARDKQVTKPAILSVRIGGNDGASKVLVEGTTSASDTSAARQVLEVLVQRMK
jgi:uncharacterized lipoprotein